jgi:exodeoxyribonuclease V beta subunit
MSAPAVDDPAPFDLTGPLPSGTVVLEASAGTGKTYTIAGSPPGGSPRPMRACPTC